MLKQCHGSRGGGDAGYHRGGEHRVWWGTTMVHDAAMVVAHAGEALRWPHGTFRCGGDRHWGCHGSSRGSRGARHLQRRRRRHCEDDAGAERKQGREEEGYDLEMLIQRLLLFAWKSSNIPKDG